MTLRVSETWQAAPVPPADGVVVVLDVLRWSTVVLTALANGASRIEAVPTPDRARARAGELPEAFRLVGGERESLRLPGFDLGNSPGEYCAARVAGKIIITTTTNGTLALLAAQGAREVVVGGFANLPALTAYLGERLEGGADVLLLCAGQAGIPTLEDTGCAGAIIAALAMRGFVTVDTLDASALAALAVWDGHDRDAARLLAASPHAAELRRKGFADDITVAAQVGSVDLVPCLGVEVMALPG